MPPKRITMTAPVHAGSGESPTQEVPSCLRPYIFHGLDFSGGRDEAVAECPFCDEGKEKFHVGLVDKDERHFAGGWHCKLCGKGGNTHEFLRELHSRSMKATKDYSWIASHRGLSPDALRSWGVCQSITTTDWIVPGMLVNGNIGNLSRYIRTKDKEGKEKYILYSTPTLSQGYFSHSKYDYKKPEVYCCEGPWDGIALWDVLRTTKLTTDKEYLSTSNEELSLIHTRNVISVPGANTFLEPWAKLTCSKSVTFLYDNDYPKTNNNSNDGKENSYGSMPGHDGMKRASKIISTVEDKEKPLAINYLDWSEKGGDTPTGHNTAYDDGFDVRDVLLDAPRDGLKFLVDNIRPVPLKWIEGKSLYRGSGIARPIDSEVCTSWKKLITAWKKAMSSFNKGPEGGLAVCLASIASVKSQGTKLWVQLLSPPSTGKTMVCDALAAAKRYCVAESDMTSFYSGWAPDGKESKDTSLAARLYDMTLISKEGDTILKSKTKDIIFSQARELFDGTGGKSFANDVKRDYEGLIFTWILAGTGSLRIMDDSELGQRFIRYTIMKDIPDELEDEIALRAAYQQLGNSKVESNCKLESTMDADYLHAVRLTVGYIEHLKRVANEQVNSIEVSDDDVLKCTRYAKFVAYLRARPSKAQEENRDRELAARLSKQFIKLMQFLTVVLNKKAVDKDVMKIIHKVAMDSADGRTLEIARAIEPLGGLGLDLRGVGSATKQTSHKESPYLEFLVKIKALEVFSPDVPSIAANGYARWRLTDAFRRLYNDVMKTKKGNQ